MRNQLPIWVWVVAVALVLGAFTSAQHVRSRDPQALVWEQVVRHDAVLDGVAGDPWQYRILAEHLVELWRFLFTSFLAASVVDGWAFLSFRILLDTLILLLAALYYRRLGLALPMAIVGVLMLAWGMSYAHFDSDFSFNTYLDVVFYLSAALLLLHRRYWWLAPLTALAALNRETGALIPFMGLSFMAIERNPQRRTGLVTVSVASAIIFAAAFIGLRVYYGSRELITAYGHLPGLHLLRFNVTRLVTWLQLLATLSLVPLIALVFYRTWPAQLKALFWAIVPVWMLVHLFAAHLAETRLLLVPQALVFIPGALFWVRQSVLAEAKGQDLITH